MSEEKIKYVTHPIFPMNERAYDLLSYNSEYSFKNSGTTIYLENSKNCKIKIYFKGFHYSFYVADESSIQGRYKEIYELAKQNDINLLGSEGYIFMIENSKFIKKIHEGNLDYYKYLGVTFSHYLIYTRENLIEILTNYPPVITIEGSVENTTTREPSKGDG